MTDDDDYKIKGAAATSVVDLAEEDGEVVDLTEEVPETKTALVAGATKQSLAHSSEHGQAEVKTDDRTVTQEEASKQQQKDLLRYRWHKCFFDPAQAQQYSTDHYFVHKDTQVSQWEEPSEPYWVWDASKQAADDSGLHYPAAPGTATGAASSAAPNQTTSGDPDPNYSGYNPKIHGNYDPNAPYAQYHKKKREEEATVERRGSGAGLPTSNAEYAAVGTFNRFTGHFQSGDKSTEHHSDANKSGRQLSAYFDVDAAANAHNGRSLKEERRNQKLPKKQIKELAQKRREKKEKKRMDFYKS